MLPAAVQRVADGGDELVDGDIAVAVTSNAMQPLSGCTRSAMPTPLTSSETDTVPSPPQSPRQAQFLSTYCSGGVSSGIVSGTEPSMYAALPMTESAGAAKRLGAWSRLRQTVGRGSPAGALRRPTRSTSCYRRFRWRRLRPPASRRSGRCPSYRSPRRSDTCPSTPFCGAGRLLCRCIRRSPRRPNLRSSPDSLRRLTRHCLRLSTPRPQA